MEETYKTYQSNRQVDLGWTAPISRSKNDMKGRSLSSAITEGIQSKRNLCINTNKAHISSSPFTLYFCHPSCRLSSSKNPPLSKKVRSKVDASRVDLLIALVQICHPASYSTLSKTKKDTLVCACRCHCCCHCCHLLTHPPL